MYGITRCTCGRHDKVYAPTVFCCHACMHLRVKIAWQHVHCCSSKAMTARRLQLSAELALQGSALFYLLPYTQCPLMKHCLCLCMLSPRPCPRCGCMPAPSDIPQRLHAKPDTMDAGGVGGMCVLRECICACMCVLLYSGLEEWVLAWSGNTHVGFMAGCECVNLYMVNPLPPRTHARTHARTCR